MLTSALPAIRAVTFSANELPRSALRLRDSLAERRVRRRHIGVLVPWANQVIEEELPRLSPDSLIWHYARLAPREGQTALDDRFLAGLLAAIPGAEQQLSRIPLEMLQVGCTSLGFSYSTRLAGGGPVLQVDTFAAIRTSLGLLSAERIALLTPYPVDIARREVDALRESGISVVTTASLGQLDDYADIPPSAVLSLVAALPTDRVQTADAIVLSCTGWPTHTLLADIEAATQRPTLSSNLAMVIAALAL